MLEAGSMEVGYRDLAASAHCSFQNIPNSARKKKKIPNAGFLGLI